MTHLRTWPTFKYKHPQPYGYAMPCNFILFPLTEDPCFFCFFFYNLVVGELMSVLNLGKKILSSAKWMGTTGLIGMDW